MRLEVPQSAIKLGFLNDSTSTHSSRTIMLSELNLLLDARPRLVDIDQYRSAVIEDNVLLKKTEATRRESFQRLRRLYALNPHTLLFRVMRDLWVTDVQARPLLALLCSTARDPILRATADLILSITEGATVTPQMFSQATSEHFPNRYNPSTLAKIGRNAASSWQQSGHLSGKLRKLRSRAKSRPAAVAYALLLGHLCGTRGGPLFNTMWAQLLDTPVHIFHEQAILASHSGWIEYRRVGDVIDISFHYLLREGAWEHES